MKILFLSPATTDTCSFYRCGGIAPSLALMGDHQIDVREWGKVIMHWEMLTRYDLIMMQRPFQPEALSLAEYVKLLGIPLWIDYDDNLLVVPPENPQADLYGPETREVIKKLISIATVVTVTTEPLKKAFEPYNKDIRVLPNAFNDKIFKAMPFTSPRSTTIAWRGSASHILDVMTKGDELNALADMNPGWQFLYLGYKPWYLGQKINVFHMGAMDVIQYFHNLRKMAPALLHVPLTDNVFNRSKSNIAWIEASYFGAITLAPDWEVWDVPGVLKYSDGQSFVDAVNAVTHGQVDIAANVSMARNYINANLMLSQINVKRLELINELL